ncbi:MAG: SOS response-associated peptidase [Anaerolineae bacterium]
MCGRYSVATPPDQLAEHFNATLPLPSPDQRPRQNAAPAQSLPVLLNDGSRQIAYLKWGLIPAWAKDPSISNKLINARAETVAEKPSFRDALNKRRCLVLADAFYEWQKTSGGKKLPIKFSLADTAPFAFAGLWETWRDAQNHVIHTFTIITTTANPLVAPIHDRMPVILPPAGQTLWLDNTASKADQLALLVPFPSELMVYAAADPNILRDFAA